MKSVSLIMVFVSIIYAIGEVMYHDPVHGTFQRESAPSYGYYNGHPLASYLSLFMFGRDNVRNYSFRH